MCNATTSGEIVSRINMSVWRGRLSLKKKEENSIWQNAVRNDMQRPLRCQCKEWNINRRNGRIKIFRYNPQLVRGKNIRCIIYFYVDKHDVKILVSKHVNETRGEPVTDNTTFLHIIHMLCTVCLSVGCCWPEDAYWWFSVNILIMLCAVWMF